MGIKAFTTTKFGLTMFTSITGIHVEKWKGVQTVQDPTGRYCQSLRQPEVPREIKHTDLPCPPPPQGTVLDVTYTADCRVNSQISNSVTPSNKPCAPLAMETIATLARENQTHYTAGRTNKQATGSVPWRAWPVTVY